MTNKKNLLYTGILLSGIVTLSGCADTWNKADNKGGFFTSSRADYIVINQSGGRIMDVYKLEDVIVSSPDNSDGWIFKDKNGFSNNLGGDIKTIRIDDKDKHLDIWNKYKEYHAEFSKGKTYFQMLNNN